MKIKLDDFAKHLQDKLQDAVDHVTSKTYMNELGNDLIKDIQKRTRLGYGVEESLGKQAKFKPLAESTKKSRKYKKRKGELSGDTSPAKSNLTETGDMVKDLYIQTKLNKLELKLKTQLSRDKAGWNEEKGRTFLNISGPQYKQLVKTIQKTISEKLKK